MSLTTERLLALAALLIAALAMTYQPADSVAWEAGDGAKHYGASHGR